jgi:2-hydroxychromene-2-carboxylate isomerase
VSRQLEFYFDYGSPYSYLADSQLGALAKRTGAKIAYRPMLLGAVFKATGNYSPAVEPIESKRRYSAVDLRRWVDHYRVEFQPNPFFPLNTLPLMRASVVAQRDGVFEAFHAAVYPAFWAEARNMGDPEVFASVLERAGIDAKPILERTADPEIKQELRETTDAAVERGVFGAPTFFVDDEIFFGADHLPFIERALVR